MKIEDLKEILNLKPGFPMRFTKNAFRNLLNANLTNHFAKFQEKSELYLSEVQIDIRSITDHVHKNVQLCPT